MNISGVDPRRSALPAQNGNHFRQFVEPPLVPA